ncbi:helix-turn-helix transcriptional regulator [Amycolatopsis thermoflava]|uniref:helix-turn-helix transcriptional regulator n=1 Tax=Amycolatopsis thermoflava TaxID=84480 RepID=UPI00382EDBF4
MDLRERWLDLVAAVRSVAAQAPAPSGDGVLEQPELALRDTNPWSSLAELADFSRAFRERTIDRPFETRRRINQALSRLRELDTFAAVMAAAPAALAHACEVGRVMISRISGSTWLPGNLYVATGEDDPVNRSLREYIHELRIQLTNGMLEAEVVRRRAPALVTDAAAEPRTFEPLVRIARSRAYVVAPVVAGGSVAALLHADNYPSARLLTPLDRDNLHAFAEGLAVIFERAVTLERMALQRERVRQFFADAEETVGALYAAPVRLTRSQPPTAAPASAAAPERRSELDLLTPREREVAALLSSGARNADIAARLTVSETTVKSHVKNILRKLQVSNRSEVISRYLRLAHDGEQRS